MTIEEVKGRMTHYFGKDDMYRMPLGIEAEDWLVSEYDRLTAANKVMDEALQRLTTARAYVRFPDEYVSSIDEWAEEILDKVRAIQPIGEDGR